ncbi:hypothetical protein T4C_8774 [Trichinella pseudospiralis]|uniref:Uncharacterized protein n=1 Tax=Trichinella pseudospiralis TaxID=6337 RepID=A0A0V1K501_TRIPS|nr:hypothetical protein T4C_8774 [Trichinella pseudospiralis]
MPRTSHNTVMTMQMEKLLCELKIFYRNDVADHYWDTQRPELLTGAHCNFLNIAYYFAFVKFIPTTKATTDDQC